MMIFSNEYVHSVHAMCLAQNSAFFVRGFNTIRVSRFLHFKVRYWVRSIYCWNTPTLELPFLLVLAFFFLSCSATLGTVRLSQDKENNESPAGIGSSTQFLSEMVPGTKSFLGFLALSLSERRRTPPIPSRPFFFGSRGLANASAVDYEASGGR